MTGPLSKLSVTSTVARLCSTSLGIDNQTMMSGTFTGAVLLTAGVVVAASTGRDQSNSPFHDYRSERPGAVHRITVADLPPPYATESVNNNPRLIPRPEGVMPQVPAGYTVSLFLAGLENPRLMRTAPNGDLFVAESRPGRVKVIRSRKGASKAQTVEVFASGLNRPFGIAFYPVGPNPQYVYIGNTNAVVRYPYRSGDLKPSGPQEVVVPELPAGGNLRGGGHWTRDIVFSRDNKKMFVSVGSHTNVDDPETNPLEVGRATVLEFNPDGSGRRIYVSGIRNAVGMALHPRTGQLWASVNERDGLGDNLVPDYITSLNDGDFFGWPWFYMGGHQDPRHRGKHPELKSQVRTPDVLLMPHSASLQMLFYTADTFAPEHRDSIYAAFHGSWNRALRTGYKVIRVPLKGDKATGEYEDFMTGFVTADGQVWGRPVGVTVAADGSLLVSDDGTNSIWRVTNTD